MPLDALGQVIRQLENQPQWHGQRQFRRVLDCWPRVVGPSVAVQTQPVRIAQGVLFVAVINSTWGQTLTFERLRILEKLNALIAPPLNDIRFSTADWFRRSPNQRGQNRSEDPEQSEVSGLVRSHPSYLPPDPTAIPVEKSPSSPPPDTALEAFQRWAQQRQQATRHQAHCPQCSCPCPSGELKRWSVCSLCAVKAWQ
ncbi:MAG TPA: DciA family protein [Trichocoleus sp.]